MTDSDLERTAFNVPDHVVFREFAAETVVLNLETGQYHGLNPTAGRMLEALTNGATPSEAATAISAEFSRDPNTVLRDILQLVKQLLERGILVETPNKSSQ